MPDPTEQELRDILRVIDEYHPEALVCWDRDVGDLAELTNSAEVIADMEGDLTVFPGTTFSSSTRVGHLWFHFVCDPYPHWDSQEQACARGFKSDTESPWGGRLSARLHG